jgi:glutamate 5-kinase
MADSMESYEELGFLPKRIILKLGSAVLTRSGDERLDENFLDDVAKAVSGLFDGGREVIIVSSGAVAAGLGCLHLTKKNKSIPEKQALAAVGQSRLMHRYSVHFSNYGRNIAQMLLNRDDMEDRRRYLNTRYTLEKLLSFGVVPIINENDTTTVDELRFGDNDVLSAIVTAKMKAEFLILLSDVDGLYNCDPRANPDAKLITRIDEINPEIVKMAANTTSKLGAGGMTSKIEAARRGTSSGAYVCICNGKKTGILDFLFKGKCPGTLFRPGKKRDLSSRARWIAFGKSEEDRVIIVDDGAKNALIAGKKSLLSVGIKSIKGKFECSDVVGICDTEGNLIAKGLVNYNSEDLAKIKGARSEDIESILGIKEYNEVIHRDNMSVFQDKN